MITTIALALLALLFTVGTVSAQSYPTTAITLVIPVTPGDATDSVGRTMGDELSKLLLGGQEDSFAHDVVLRIEETVHGLEAEIGHADPVGVWERQRNAHASGVRFEDVPRLFG